MSSRHITVGLALVAALSASARAQTIWYVDDDADPNGVGTSWQTAFQTLQAALDVVTAGDEIHVAGGAYVPSQQTDPNDARTATFQLINGVGLYGAYAGLADPNNPDARDPNAFTSTLTGDVDGDDDPNQPHGENAYHVITAAGVDATAAIDGFTVAAGRATGPHEENHHRGAGMYCTDSNPNVSNCRFSLGLARDGGGICNDLHSSPSLANCAFNNNRAYSYGRGGAIYNSDHSSPALIHCTFSGNSAFDGGGVYNDDHSSPTLTDCTFSGNWADEFGGAMFNVLDSSPAMTDCTFSGNTADRSGGALFSEGNCSLTLTGCTFDTNSAHTESGGAISGGSNLSLTDCIFIGNQCLGTGQYSGGGALFNEWGYSVLLSNCHFIGNSTNGGDGGAVYSAFATLDGCTFSDNSSGGNGGGVSIGAEATFHGCFFSDNCAEDNGGAIAGAAEVFDCEFTNNGAGNAGGAMVGGGLIQGCLFTGNSASGPFEGPYPGGGGALCTGGEIIDCEFLGNTAWASDHVVVGGAMLLRNTNALVSGCVFDGNSASLGGGLFTYNNDLTLTDCVFNENSADLYGGGMECVFSSATLTNCTFGGNAAQLYGGAIECYGGGQPMLVNCTFSGNTASVAGGAVGCWDNGRPRLRGCTFAMNSAPDGSALACYRIDWWDDSSLIRATNCIFWNSGNDNEIHNGDGSTITITYSDVLGGWPDVGNINADPLFVRDPNEGGDGWGDDPNTPDDESANDDYGDLDLQSGSPCIDAGDNTAVPADVADLDGDGDVEERTPLDLEGTRRFVNDPNTVDTGVADPPDYLNVVDMGAYEFGVFGDLDGDCDVDLADLAQLLGQYGETSGMTYEDGDLDGDGDVDLADLAALLGVYGDVCS